MPSTTNSAFIHLQSKSGSIITCGADLKCELGANVLTRSSFVSWTVNFVMLFKVPSEDSETMSQIFIAFVKQTKHLCIDFPFLSVGQNSAQKLNIMYIIIWLL